MKRLVFLSVLFWMFFLISQESQARIIILLWDPSSGPDLAGYKLYYGTATRTGSDPKTCGLCGYSSIQEVGNKTCYCFETDGNDLLYFSVIAYDTDGSQSAFSNEAAFFYGDISTDSRIDGIDLATLGLHFGQLVPARNFNCNTCLGDTTLSTDLQRADINRDGRVDGLDLIELGIRFGLIAQ